MRNETHQTTPERMTLPAVGVADALGISTRQIWKMLAAGRLPEPIRLGRCVRWRLDEIRAWVAAGCPVRAEWEAQRGRTGVGR